MHWQTENVCKLAGYTGDLEHLLPENKQLVCHCICFTGISRKWYTSCLTTQATWSSLQFQWQWSAVSKTLGLTELHLVHTDVSFIPMHLCVAIKRRCFKYISFAVSSAMFINNFNVHFIWSYVNETFIRSITSCTPLQHPISEEEFVHSFILCVSFIILSTTLFIMYPGRYRVSVW